MQEYRFDITASVQVEAFTLEDALAILEDYFGQGRLTEEITITSTEVVERD